MWIWVFLHGKKLAKEISALQQHRKHKNSSETHLGSICRMFEKYVLDVLTSMQPVKLPTPPPPPTHTHLFGINGIRYTCYTNPSSFKDETLHGGILRICLGTLNSTRIISLFKIQY
jgi:hypothetical protein